MADTISKKITKGVAGTPSHQKLWWEGTAILGSVFYLSLLAAVNVPALGVQMAWADDASSTLEASSAPTQADCKLDDAVKTLLAVEDSDMLEPGRDLAELKARKDVLAQIVICSEVELAAFKKRLNDFDLKDSDPKDGLLRDKFLSNIDTAETYLTHVQSLLSGK